MVVGAIVLSLAASAFAQEIAKATVQVGGIRIVGAGYGGEENDELRAFNWQQGTTLAILVSVPQGGLIEFDDDASTVNKFVDDKGTDLKPAKGRWQRGVFGGFTRVSKDGKAAMIEIGGGAVPVAGAKEIHVSGTLVFKAGSKKETFTHKDVPVKIGSKISAGKVAFEVSKMGKPEWGDAAFEITLRTEQPITEIAGIAFMDARGNVIESDQAGKSWGGKASTLTYNLAQKVDTVTVAITFRMDLREEKVPFDVKAGVGL